jgi:hypothetical protein
MAREIPEAVRAAAGLAATVLDEARKLPETLPGLPVRAIGLAMQASMKLQQHYAGLVARGDELFTGLLGEHEPGLATFDDEIDTQSATVTPAAATPSGYRESAFDRAEAPTVEEDHLDVAHQVLEELAIEDLVDAGPVTPEAGVEGAAGALLDVDRQAAKAPAEVPARTAEPAPPAAAKTAGGGTSEPATAPIDGYDDFSIAQLRGRLRGYAASTVEGLLAYEEATRARQPYLRMLRNRLERLDAQAVEASPLAPRGT